MIADIAEDRGLDRCELQFNGCSRTLFLAPAHRKKRIEYSSAEELADFNEWLCLDTNCHDVLECNKLLTEIAFGILRDNDYVLDDRRIYEALEVYQYSEKDRDGILRSLHYLWSKKQGGGEW